MSSSPTANDVAVSMRLAAAKSDWREALRLSRSAMALPEAVDEAEFLARIAAQEVEYETALSSCISALWNGQFDECDELCRVMHARWPGRLQVADRRFHGPLTELQERNQRRRKRFDQLTAQITAKGKGTRWLSCGMLCAEALSIQPSNTELVSLQSECSAMARGMIGLVAVGICVLAAATHFLMRGTHGEHEANRPLARQMVRSDAPSRVAVSDPVSLSQAGAATSASDGMPRNQVDDAQRAPPSAKGHGGVSVTVGWADIVPSTARDADRVAVRVGTNVWSGVPFPFAVDMASGSYEVAASAPGYFVTGPSYIEARAGHTTDVAFVLSPRPSSIAFRSNVSGMVTATEEGKVVAANGGMLSLTPFVPHVLIFQAEGYYPSAKKLKLLAAGATFTNPVVINLVPRP